MDVSVGQEIDGYQILDVLGRGGMGVVYLAEDVALSRKVALKMIDPSLARDEAFLRRFRAEARALARIDSPYIVRVHALRQTDGGVFIVMEYVEGGTLADPIGQGPMAWSKAVPLIKQMLHAFSHAHGVGVVHRDIKPSNIMLTPQGVVKVTDFGLAKLHQKNVDATVTQGISGTLFYMSPEQVRGQRDIDHRTDLYSLGMTIYEMLAGRVPLDRSEGQFTVLKRIVEEKPVPPTRFTPDLPEGLVQIVMKALEKEPSDRYQSAEEMLRDIEAFEEGAFGGQVTHHGRGLPRKNPAPRALFVGAAAVTFVLLVVAGILAYRTWVADGTSARLTVTTAPEGAMVFIGEQFLGTTPLRDRPIDPGRAVMRLSKDGFITVDTTLVIERGTPLMLDLQMTESATAGSASATITSTPADVEVWIQGEQVGRTPFKLDSLPPGTLTIYLRKNGFEDLELQEELLPGEKRVIAAVLHPEAAEGGGESSTTQTAPRGVLIVHAEGSGRVEVDGRPVSAGSPNTVGAGTHRIACGEGSFRTESSTNVAANSSRSVTCHFRSKVNVVATMSDGTSTWASVWINGQNRGLAPIELTLPMGTYRIAVQRDGFSALDGERTITVKPSLEPQTEHLAFRISRK